MFKDKKNSKKSPCLLHPMKCGKNFFFKECNGWWHYLLAVFFIVFLLISGSIITFERLFIQRVYPNIYADNIELTGAIKPQVKRLLQERVHEILSQEIIFNINGQVVSFIPTKLTKPGEEKEFVKFNINKLADEIFAVGRQKDTLTNLKEQAEALVFTKRFYPEFNLNKEWLQQILEEQLTDIIEPSRNAQLKIEEDQITGVKMETYGHNIDYQLAAEKLKNQLSSFEKIKPIQLSLIDNHPQITSSQAEIFKKPAEELLSLAPLTLTTEDKEWAIDRSTLGQWMELQHSNGLIKLSLNKNRTQSFISSLGAEINRLPVDAEFEIKDEKVIKFQPQSNGLELDVEKSFEALLENLLQQRQNNISLKLKETKPNKTLEAVNDLGIKELVGVGKTDFKGSPPNRVKNISRGAELLQWKLIKPDEEFSVLNALKPFNYQNGYFSELVIKGNRTVPEVGGGLCQVGTTMFRVVLDAGLPVTARRNHSYRVSYYEPPVGMDATIYDPAPDFKFLNDTKNYLLLTTRIEGTELIFELWGTKDGRVATTTEPVAYDFVSPPPKKIIETTELKPGQTRCTERAHVGSKAKFTYTVTYNNGEVKEEDFYSKYRPWQEVCLVGVEPPPPEKKDNEENQEESEEQKNGEKDSEENNV